ncbi:glycosyltransferase family 2 protein, partial [Candidatus Saccharibacteria bacterium]|nr:glycosyltransferase family 2 protein [Candidatus Saccharibacteria bacterium]
FLRECLDSVKGQLYENWELCIVDDASPDEGVRKIILEYASDDDRIKTRFLKKNRHIADATNEAVSFAQGEYVALFDHDDILWPNALYEVVKALNDNQDIDFIYTDEDKITEDRFNHIAPFFKPDWNPDFLHSVNYITHFSVIRKTIYDSIGGERKDYNGAQDWDLFLRVARATRNIYHIPKVVYSWRIHDMSTAKTTDSKPYVVAAQKGAIEDDLRERGFGKSLVARDEKHSGYWRVIHPLGGTPLISIIIPTKNQKKIAKQCIDSIYKETTYSNFEIILVDTGSDDPGVKRWYDQLLKDHDNITFVDWPEQPFSYARSCNEGARIAKGEILVMLNNDTEVISPDWLEQLGGEVMREQIGAAGPLLLYPDGKRIQHAGVGVGLGGVAANSFSMMTLSQPMTQTQHLMINTRHNVTAVTGACMAIRKTVFDEIGGFDEDFRITYNDVDLCLRLIEAGYYNLYTPHVRLKHHESLTLGLPEEVARRDTAEFKSAKQQFIERWKKYIDHDPNINAHLDKSNAFYELDSKNTN